MAGVYSGLDHARFVVDKVAFGQDFLCTLRFPLSLPFHQCLTLVFILYTSLIRRTSWRELRIFKQTIVFRKQWSIENTILSIC